MCKFLTLFTAGVLLSALAVADDDPPSRAARLSYMAGTVTFQPQGEETDWAPADLNRTLTTGDKIWVEQGGRTEIQTLNSAIRLNGHTNFSFLTVDDNTTQIQLSLGVMIVRLRSLDENETYEIDTPQVAFTLLRPGVYRIEVNEAGDTTVINNRGGDGETTADGKAAPLHVNEQVIIRGTANASYDKHGVPRPDEFDAWSNERDAKVDSSVSVKMVAPGVVGVTDLDVAGSWRPAPVYGNVWFPNGLVADWAPYRFGHWGFVAPWGWTWIDDSPWGYAPFHYGRWVMVGGAWGWAPGPIAVRAMYAPALVSFIGGVEIVGVADPVSWVALSWGEPWYPSFGVSWGYYNSVNLCGTVFAAGIIAGVWGGAAVNLSFGHDYRAVNVVGREGFAGGHGVGREFAHRDRFGGHAFDHAGARREGVRGIGASREGRFGGHAPLRAGSRGLPPHGAMGRSAVTRHEPGAHNGNFRGAGVAAKHGASANGGHAGSFKPAAAHNSGAAGSKAGTPSHSTPSASHAAPSHSSTPAGGKAGSPNTSHAASSHSSIPAGGKAGTPSASKSASSHSSTPAGGKAGTPSTSHSSTPNTSKSAASPATGRSSTPATHTSTPSTGAGRSPSSSGMQKSASSPSAGRPAGGSTGATHNPVGGGGMKPAAAAPRGGGGGGATHPAAPTGGGARKK